MTLSTGSTAIPCLRYRRCPDAIDWLCDVIGFERHLVVTEPEGSITHAQLTLGAGMVMLGTVSDTEFGRLMRQPDEIEMAETQTVYLVVKDIDAVYQRVIDADAPIVIRLKREDYGGHSFSCRDPEGHLWNFGSYDPWQDDGAHKDEAT